MAFGEGERVLALIRKALPIDVEAVGGGALISFDAWLCDRSR